MSTLHFSTLLACSTLTLLACQNNSVSPDDHLPSDAAGNIRLLDECDGISTDHSGITVEFVGTSFKSVTSNDGRFQFENVPAGSYTIQLSKPGYVPVQLKEVRFQGKHNSFNDLSLRPLPEWSIASLGVQSFVADSHAEIEVAWDLSAQSCRELPGRHIAFYLSDIPDVSSTSFKMVRTITPDWKEQVKTRIPILAQEMRAHGFAKGAKVYVIAYPAVNDPNDGVTVTHEETKRFVGSGHSAVVEFTTP